MKEIKFNGKVAVITGAASGMGLYSAKEFVRLGAKVIMCDVNEEALAQAAAEIGEAAIPVCGDVREYAYAEAVAAEGGQSLEGKVFVVTGSVNHFKNRKELLKVAKLGKSAYEQCAGFIRIYDGDNALEITAVHPESYEVAEKLLEKIGYAKNDLKDKQKLEEIRTKLADINLKEVKETLEVGEMTLKDIIAELSKPGRDPREEMPKPILRSDVLKFEDLQEGMELTGTVRNVIDFGAFVDVGVKHDGLVHISELSDKFIKNPSEVVSVGDIVKVRVIGIDREKQKVSLSMKL